MPISYASFTDQTTTASRNGLTPLQGKTPDCQGQGEIIIAKHRNGSLENIRLRFISHLAKFTDLDAFGFSNDDVMPSSMNNDAPF
jgi:replicative DNA helicase